MRIHSDILTEADLYRAARESDLIFETFSKRGSRSRKNAFDFLCSGNSTRNSMSNNFKAGTWDQYGVFLGILFDIDDDMHTGKHGYQNKEDYDRKTNYRFEDADERSKIDVKSSHGHKWNYLEPYTSQCKCGAIVRWQ